MSYLALFIFSCIKLYSFSRFILFSIFQSAFY
jgi:hypothetical protein